MDSEQSLLDKIVAQLPVKVPGRCPKTGRSYSNMPEDHVEKGVAPNCSECGTQLRPQGMMGEFGYEHQ